MTTKMEIVEYKTPFGVITMKQKHDSIKCNAPSHKKILVVYTKADGYFRIVSRREV